MRKKEKRSEIINTFVGSGANIEGTIEFQGTIRLDGAVRGKIRSEGGTVIIGETAVIEADMYVDVAVIMGEFSGTIDAKDRIELYPPSRIIGDIQAPVISIDAGVMFNGNCAMKARTISSEPLAVENDKSVNLIEEIKG